uniref:ATP-dependent zinc metalloprotease FtsH n=1 Tax=Zeugodacus cucurbitae TaxID=28588 RepID=A0A0A1XBR0_ZEUCU
MNLEKSVIRQMLCLLLISYVNLPGTLAAPNLLTSYLPASMQALAYYIDFLQYEPISSTTVEPPFSVSDDELTNIFNASPTTTPLPIRPPTSALSTNKQPSTWVSTTSRPNWSSTSNKPSQTVSTTGSGWWKPPNWWNPSTTTTAKPTVPPTPTHRPGLYAPMKSPLIKPRSEKRVGYEVFDEIGDNTEGFDKLTLALIRDIQTEAEHDEFTNDVESLDNFLRLYDDNYGRAAFDDDNAVDRWSTTSTAGKKRVPPTKPYVEFLLVYDLLKRDAKAANLSKYEGYSEELLRDLHDLSSASAERQLYTLFKRMIDRGDVQRSDVVSRLQGIMKDLANPQSATAKELRYIPAMPFVP